MDDFDPESDDTPPMPPHVFETLRSFLIATAGFWLIVAWAVWQMW